MAFLSCIIPAIPERRARAVCSSGCIVGGPRVVRHGVALRSEGGKKYRRFVDHSKRFPHSRYCRHGTLACRNPTPGLGRLNACFRLVLDGSCGAGDSSVVVLATARVSSRLIFVSTTGQQSAALCMNAPASSTREAEEHERKVPTENSDFFELKTRRHSHSWAHALQLHHCEDCRLRELVRETLTTLKQGLQRHVDP